MVARLAAADKTWALLLDALRYAALAPVPDFGAVIFRRTSPQITQQGGLWDEASKLYPLAGGKPNMTRLEWSWPQHKTRIRFAHLQYDSDMFDWQGSQIGYLAYDELTHFSEQVFFYLFSRNRSMCGVKPRIVATTNPDPDSWVKAFIAPWVDLDHPRPAASGEIRRFVRESGAIRWLAAGETHPDSKSVTFIRASVYDNPALLRANPAYLANLKAMPLVERRRLLDGDWTIRATGNMLQRHWFPILDSAPEPLGRTVRRWDFAATEPRKGYSDPDYTCGVKLAQRPDGGYVVLDVLLVRLSPGDVERLVCQTAALDGPATVIRWEQEPGSAGKAIGAHYVRLLDGYDAGGVVSSGNKEVRARAFSAQAQAHNISLVRAPWNAPYLNQLAAFPDPHVHDDAVDASAGAHSDLVGVLRKIPLVDEPLTTPTAPPATMRDLMAQDPFAWARDHGIWADE